MQENNVDAGENRTNNFAIVVLRNSVNNGLPDVPYHAMSPLPIPPKWIRQLPLKRQ